MENEEERKDVSETKTYLCDLCFYKKQNVKAVFECSACCQLFCEECDAVLHKFPCTVSILEQNQELSLKNLEEMKGRNLRIHSTKGTVPL